MSLKKKLMKLKTMDSLSLVSAIAAAARGRQEELSSRTPMGVGSCLSTKEREKRRKRNKEQRKRNRRK